MSSVVAGKLPSVTTKFQVGAGAAAVAAAAMFTPAVAAQADVAVPSPLAPVTQVLDAGFAQDFNWWWVGQANPTPPKHIVLLEFRPLALIPGFLEDAWKQWTANWNFQVCFLGAGVKVGPYGTVTVSVGRGC